MSRARNGLARRAMSVRNGGRGRGLVWENGMRAKRFWYLGATVALAPLFGCVIAADLVNPGFFGSFGLDPGTVTPPAGRVIVAYNNQTQFVARFHVLALDSTQTNGFEQTGDVDANGVGNSVF